MMGRLAPGQRGHSAVCGKALWDGSRVAETGVHEWHP